MTTSLFELADADFLSREQAQALAQRVLSFARADETRVNIASGWSGNTRFAGNEITTSGGTTNTSITVTSTVGKRRASASTNILDDESLKRTVDLAERLAKLSPEDPEAMPELGAQSYTPVNGYFERTADLTPEIRAVAAKRVLPFQPVRTLTRVSSAFANERMRSVSAFASSLLRNCDAVC